MNGQLDLFPDDQQPTEPQVDLDEKAARIAAAARFTGSPDRTSEAAKEQGHGPRNVVLDTDVGHIPVDNGLTIDDIYTDVRVVDGVSSICAIGPDGTIIASRGTGENPSGELHGLVLADAAKKLGL